VRLEALGNLAHELRTPLQVMLGYLDILRDQWGQAFGAEPQRILGRMNLSAHQLAQTVENLIEMAAADGDTQPCADEDLTIRELVAELLPTFEAAIENKRLELRFDLDRAPEKIRSRRRPLSLIVQNLMLNAIRFTAAGSVTFTAASFGAHDAGLRIEVRDTGIGMRPAQIERACAPFAQLSRSSARRYRGLGLGLAVVQRNLAALGGKLEARSTPGAGSTFIATIPGQIA
jgi:signal transduction histidine kinase